MLIEKLEGESQELHTVMSKMETNQNKGKDWDNARTLSSLAREEKDFQQLISDERTNIKALDEQVTGLDWNMQAKGVGRGFLCAHSLIKMGH